MKMAGVMERRRLGRTGIMASVLGFGASEIGEQGASVRTVERLVGRTSAHRRKEYYIATKCGHAAGLRLQDWTPELIEKSIERSLQRLRTDYIDVIQLHSCCEETLRRGDVIEALIRAREKGRVRYLGYSGDRRGALYAVECG